MLEEFLFLVEHIKRLRENGNLDEAERFLDKLEPIATTNIQTTRSVVAAFLDLGLTGRANVSLAKYCQRNPDDQDALLDFIELKIKTKFYQNEIPDDVVSMLDLKSASQIKRLGNCWKSVGNHRNAIACYKQVTELTRDEPNSYADLAQMLIYLGRKKEARAALHTLADLVGNQLFWWCFIAEQSSKIADRRLFRAAVLRITPFLSGEHGINRMALVAGFENFKDYQTVRSILDSWDLSKLTEGWVIARTLDVAERANAAAFHLSVAKRALGLNLVDKELTERCTHIVESYNRF